MEPLHLKYRPQTISDLAGQPIVERILTNALAQNHLSQAYLFAGPRGTGKTSTARILAKSINCLEADTPTPEPCQQCASCRAIERSQALDLTEIDAASHNGVNEIRTLIEHLANAPVQGRRRIIILDEVHMLSNAAFNALLKTLEEPPSHATFILCTTELHKVLPTIISRCQRLDFRALTVPTIITRLAEVASAEGINISNNALKAIALNAEGGLRDALQLLEQVHLMHSSTTIEVEQVQELLGSLSEKELLKALKAIAASDVFALLSLTRTWITEGKTPKAIFESLLRAYRDLLIINKSPQATTLLSSDLRAKTLRKLKTFTPEIINQSLTVLQTYEHHLNSNRPDVWLETCLLNLIPDFTTGVETTIHPVLINSNNIGHDDKTNGNGNGSIPPTEPDLESIWEQLILNINSPKWQKLLKQATLTELNLEAQTATLLVPNQYCLKFENNSTKLETKLENILDQPIQLQIKPQEVLA